MAREPRPGKPIPATLRARCDSAAPARCASQTMREASSPSHANANAQRAVVSRMSRKSCARSAVPCLRIEQCAYRPARYESGFSRRPRRSHRQHRAQPGSAWSGRARPRMPDSRSPIAPCHRHIGQRPSPMTVFVISGSLSRSFSPPSVGIPVPRQGCRLCRSGTPYCRLPRRGSFYRSNATSNDGYASVGPGHVGARAIAFGCAGVRRVMTQPWRVAPSAGPVPTERSDVLTKLKEAAAQTRKESLLP